MDTVDNGESYGFCIANNSSKRGNATSINVRTRSASLGRDRKSDLRARYWAFLFENLQHAIDELYHTCETDENISECKEVILVLENYTREFHNLAEWFRVKWEYENTPPPQRPNSLAWEIRKSSPGKVFRRKQQPVSSGVACRELLYELNKESCKIYDANRTIDDDGTSAKSKIDTKPSEGETEHSKNDHKMVTINVETNDRSSQTSDELSSVAARKPALNVGRKTVANNNNCYTKKIPRNISTVMSAAETKISAASSKRLGYVCVSPRKPVPVPGRNIAAAVFVPGEKITTNGGVKLPTSNALDDTHKAKIPPPSQSDTFFETVTVIKTAKRVVPEEKPYTRVECNVRANIVNTCSASKFASTCCLGVINEASVNDTCQREDDDDDDVEFKQTKNEKRDSVTETVSPNVKSLTVDTSSRSTTPGPITMRNRNLVSSNQANSTTTTTTTTATTTTTTTTKEDRKLETSSGGRRPMSELVRKFSRDNRDKVISRMSERADQQMSKKNRNVQTMEKQRITIGSAVELPQFSEGRKTVGRDSTNAIITRSKMRNNVATVKLQNVSKEVPKKSGNATLKNKLLENDKWRPKVNVNATTKRGLFQDKCRREAGQHGGKYATMMRSKTSIDMKSSSTTTNERVPTKETARTRLNDENQSPPKHRRNSKDTDGWETVTSRSRRSVPISLSAKGRSFDVNNRFHEPSSSTSLPTLIMLGSDRYANDTKTKATEAKNRNRNRNNSHTFCGGEIQAAAAVSTPTPTTVTTATAMATTTTTTTTTLATALNEGVVADADVQNNRNYKVLVKERPIITAMFSTVPSKRRKPNEKDVRKTKLSRETRNAPKIKCSNQSDEQSKDEDLLDEESLRKSKELYEKEISLQKEINDLQNDADLETDLDVDVDVDVDVDLDSDSTEADQEIVDLCRSNKDKNAFERRAALEAKYNHILINMSWAEQIETLDKLEELLDRDPSGKSLKFAKNFTSLKQFEDLVTRAPGRALELHQKLSSPSRKRTSPDSTILQHKARQAKAKQNREQLLQDKSAKIRELLNKVAEVKIMQAQLANERRKLYEQKLKRAEENRNLHLKNIQDKAHDEAKKQKEIAFINELEAQNKRHDFYALLQEQEDRFQSILGERQRRQEEKAAKDAAVEERRKAIEAERQEKIEELQEKMRKREERIDRELQEKERERVKMAREKARDREDRLLALQAAQIANAEELQKKIQQKQENSARRHEENIELIRQKAIEIGTPRLTPYQINKLCSVCNVVIDSEVFLLSHLKGKSHQEAIKKYREQFEVNIKFSECSIIMNAPADILHEKKNREKERQKTLRKRCKKIRHRLSNRSEEYAKNTRIATAVKEKSKKIDSSNKGRLLKSVKEIDKVINTQGNGVWPNNAVTMLERNLFEIVRILDKGVSKNQDDQYMFKTFDGFAVLSKIYNLGLDVPKNMSPYLPLKCFVVTSNLFAIACRNNVENCLHVLLSNIIVQILDLLLNRLNLIMPNSDDRNGMVVYKADTVADVLMNLCSNVFSVVTAFLFHGDHKEYDSNEISAHLQDVVSYIVCTGIVDKLAVYCSSVHDNKSADSYFLLHCMELLTRLVETRRGRITDKEDCTQLMDTLKVTELVGAVSMLYAMLLHRDSISNDNSSVIVELPADVVNVIIATLRLFSKVGELNLKFFQNILGAEGISLQVRHIISYLLRYCTQNEGYKHLLHQVIEFIGFFAIHHTDNQMILQSGSTPTVLQQLSSLPFTYFSNPTLVRILFPTLLACCTGNAQNRAILDQEVSFQLLEDFRNAEDARDIPLIRLLREN